MDEVRRVQQLYIAELERYVFDSHDLFIMINALIFPYGVVG
jgi:hypothetical protein